MKSLYHELIEYSKKDVYPFHMPGHKRNTDYSIFENDPIKEVLGIDITEISGFDNLHGAKGIIADAQIRAAGLYGSKYTFFLVNGSTLGNLCALSALSSNKDSVIIGRNCHKSVYNAAYLNKLEIISVYPNYSDEFDINLNIASEDIEEAIQKELERKKRIAAVVITSPSYEGVVSDVKAIAEIAHKYDIPLLVDEAHGAHFAFSDELPVSAIDNADIVVHSVHKTLMSATQTALLHICSDRVSVENIKKYLDIYETSSPSYILMASIDRSMEIMEKKGKELINHLSKLREYFDRRTAELNNIKIADNTEIGKILISLNNCDKSGLWLFEQLRDKYGIELEMANASYALAMLTIADSYEGVEILSKALLELDNEVMKYSSQKETFRYPVLNSNTEFYKAFDSEYEEIELEAAEGKAAADFLYLYPPGSPIVIPGEEFDKKAIDIIKRIENKGFDILGIRNNRVRVIKNGEINIPDREELFR